MAIIEKLDDKVIEFIKEHHLMAVATVFKNVPYSFHCFYAYIEEERMFVFTSHLDTTHVQNVLKNNFVSAAIGLETKNVAKIQGLQIVGKMYEPKDEMAKISEKRYLKKFPYTRLIPRTIWVIEPDFLKMTDNRLIFGEKLIYGKISDYKEKI